MRYCFSLHRPTKFIRLKMLTFFKYENWTLQFLQNLFNLRSRLWKCFRIFHIQTLLCYVLIKNTMTDIMIACQSDTFYFILLTIFCLFSEGDRSNGMKTTYNPLFSPSSRDPSAESVTSLISTSTGNSISPQSTFTAPQQRPHSITSKNNG